MRDERTPENRISFLTRALRGEARGDTAVLQGVRSVLALGVVTGHTHLLSSALLADGELVEVIKRSSAATRHTFLAALAMGSGAVDGFLFLSGFQAAATLVPLLAQGIDNTKLGSRAVLKHVVSTLVRYALARWLRLAPLHTALALLWRAAGAPGCVHPAELFFMRGFFVDLERTAASQFCVGHGWSLELDARAHFIISILVSAAAALVTFVGARNKRKSEAAAALLVAGAIFSTVWRGVAWVGAGRPVSRAATLADVLPDGRSVAHVAHTLGLRTPPLQSVASTAGAIASRRASHIAYQPFYFRAAFRIAPALIGAATFILAISEWGQPVTHAVRRWRLLATAFVLFTALFFTIGFGVPYNIREEPAVQVTLASHWYLIYECAGRLLLSFSMVVLTLLTCSLRAHTDLGLSAKSTGILHSYDDCGRSYPLIARWLRAALGNRMLVALSRFSYAVYLNHVNFAVVFGVLWPRLTRANYTFGLVLLNAIKLYIVSVVLCVPVCIFEEAMLSVRSNLLCRFDTVTGISRTRNEKSD